MADRILDPIHGNDYDARGGRTSLTDPSGQTTTWDFDGFGDMIAETRPGSPIPYETRTYDNFGRVQTRTMASGEVVEHVYDIGGDPVEERWLNAPTTDTEPLTTRVFDELGRITQTTYANHALAPFGVGDPTVTTTRDYDPLGRVVGESLTALGVTTQTTSSFDAGTGNWIRSATYPSGSQIYEERDQTRRLARSTRISALTADASQSSFAWLGNLPAGRAYSAADLSTTDPFTESAEYDGFGRRTAWQWDALAFAGSSPQNAGFADAYCDGNYDASRCGGPVLQIDAVRDVMGRIASLESRFGHPMTAGSPLPDSAHDTSWHGYTYTRRGYLQRDWNHLGADVVTSSVLANTDTDLAVDALGNSLPTAIALDQLREPDVGSLVSIGVSGEDPLWQTLAPRDDGHRLTAVEVDQTTYAIAHDDDGRMTEGIDWDFGYDPNNRIASATNQVNGLYELYLYTADGDLAAVIDVRNNSQVFGYDGDRMVVSFDDAGTPQWEATYGDRIDQLIEYHEFGAAGPVVPLLDHRNSPVATWAPNMVAVDQPARYDAHGRLTLLDSTESIVCVEQDTGRVCDAPSGLPFAFNGRWRSPATGLVNMRARWYSPRLGEFTAPDPLGYVDLYDIRGFAAFDPINRWDPLGLEDLVFGDIMEVRVGLSNSELPDEIPVGVSSARVMQELRDLQCQTGQTRQCRNPGRQTSTDTEGGRGFETSGAITVMKEVIELTDEQRREGLRADGVSERRHSPNPREVERILARDAGLKRADIWAQWHSHPRATSPSQSDQRGAATNRHLVVVVSERDVWLVVPTRESDDFMSTRDASSARSELEEAAQRATPSHDLSEVSRRRAREVASVGGLVLYRYVKGSFVKQ